MKRGLGWMEKKKGKVKTPWGNREMANCNCKCNAIKQVAEKKEKKTCHLEWGNNLKLKFRALCCQILFGFCCFFVCFFFALTLHAIRFLNLVAAAAAFNNCFMLSIAVKIKMEMACKRRAKRHYAFCTIFAFLLFLFGALA